MATGTLVRSVIEELAKHLRTKIPELPAVREFWPSPNEQLKLPSVAIVTRGDMQVERHPPYELKDLRGAIVETADGQKRMDTVMVTARYEIPLMVHLWAASMEARAVLLEKLGNALNPSPSIGGLSLSLSRYYGAAVRFTTMTEAYGDNEEAAQRNEWRVMLAVDADGNSIVARSQGAILEPVIESEITDYNP